MMWRGGLDDVERGSGGCGEVVWMMWRGGLEAVEWSYGVCREVI